MTIYITKYVTTRGILTINIHNTPNQDTPDVRFKDGAVFLSHIPGMPGMCETLPAFFKDEWAPTIAEARAQAIQKIQRAIISAQKKVDALQKSMRKLTSCVDMAVLPTKPY
jgi:hypothetical protein